MNTSNLDFRTIVLIAFVATATAACETYTTTVARQPYYSMSTNCAGQTVFTPIPGTDTITSNCTSSCAVATTSNCGTPYSSVRSVAYTKTMSGNAYKVGSYPSYQYYNAGAMPMYGTYYYQMGPTR